MWNEHMLVPVFTQYYRCYVEVIDVAYKQHDYKQIRDPIKGNEGARVRQSKMSCYVDLLAHSLNRSHLCENLTTVDSLITHTFFHFPNSHTLSYPIPYGLSRMGMGYKGVDCTCRFLRPDG
ncbi:hypothetical protein M404DRAFT_789872 [Pisolithus tinctorius Marx 270]|uniref:Uncharacterized protein n=1 Tax=Pisolithus tinctorius Marx 270 TaxID=870435 RepID=A0A0C3PR89_PISTI|nr:hypothetical protein M404DRAFT_789872 [Pisolithus tinctorius Marx 270]